MLIIPLGKKGSEGIPIVTLFVCLACILVLVFANTPADRLAALFCKAEASRTGTIRGHRHIMLDDSDINATRHARALVGGVLAGRIGDTRLFVSGGAEHQGPEGGGPLAVILSLRS